ncbi:PP2C family protein-serine/threonine phosphatase [uncultured Sphingomonas sp.]|uniref:PP2C family protein-serine/threonine phosphatase n=1 Tax=uncultured Sphingomonas sp. TaxID=158754 RepID=UPI0035CB6FA6
MSALLARWRRGAAGDDVPVVSAARTHVGRVRAINEDRVLDRADRRLWAIADGMGGHGGGDVAADAAIAALAAMADAAAPITAGTTAAALATAHRRIAAGAGPSGTTIVVLHLAGASATVSWAGDSRCYLVRDGAVRQLTRDHSVVQELIDAGILAPRDAARHPSAHVVTRALGVEPLADLEALSVETRPGDRLLLCSDGASRSLVDRDLAACEAVPAYADRLLTAALQRDGTDNISVIAVAIGPEPTA